MCSILFSMCHRARNKKSATSSAMVRVVEKSGMMNRSKELPILLSSSNRLHASVRVIEAKIPQARNVDPNHCLRLLLEDSSNSRYAGLHACRGSLKGGAARQILTSFTLVTIQVRNMNNM
jgi:hypothetical protein